MAERIADDLVPTAKLLANLTPLAGNGRKKVVLLTTGAYCPIHFMHTALFESAKAFLEKNNSWDVVAGFISPSHDAYVLSKLLRNGYKMTQANVFSQPRYEMVKLATAESSWLSACKWEVAQSGFRDFPEVSVAVRKIITAAVKAAKIDEQVDVFYISGADHAYRCGLYNELKPKWADGLIFVARPEKDSTVKAQMQTLFTDAEKKAKGKLVYVTLETEDMSSSLIRDAMIASDHMTLAKMLHPSVLQYIAAEKINFTKK